MKSKGFTLIELIIVIAVFLFIIGATIGIFLSIIQSQKKVLAEQQFLNQVSYVEEYMSKALRMAKTAENEGCILSGYIYLLTQRNLSTGFYQGIKFLNQSTNTCQEFYLAVASPTDSRLVLWEVKGNNPPVALTPTSLQFNSTNPIRFSINGLDGSPSGLDCADNLDQCGASDTDGVQPRVTILLNVSILGEPARTIQTTVSRRNLNILNVE